MKTSIVVQSLQSSSRYHEDIQLATHCPCCGVRLTPLVVHGAVVDGNDEEEHVIFVLNFCAECNECFISRHSFDEESGEGFSFDFAAPLSHFQHDFSESISHLSPDFVSIYNQALHAEEIGLTSICGMGYRKALEFLIKDYTIHKNPGKKDEIAKKQLMACINDYINDSRLKSLATAATWLGNDETHYTRKHKDYDLNNLKIFINAFVTFIDADMAYEEAVKLIK